MRGKKFYRLSASSCRIKLIAESDQMEDHLQMRQQHLNQITSIMQNINMIAKDINLETKAQGEKLLVVDRDMGKTVDNTEGALKELKEATLKQKRNYKWVASILLFAVLLLALTIISF
jgi:t-SNARE complex subunit (syntaxin)